MIGRNEETGVMTGTATDTHLHSTESHCLGDCHSHSVKFHRMHYVLTIKT